MKTHCMCLSVIDDFSLLSYITSFSLSGVNSLNEYLFHIYNVPEILLGIIKSEITAIVPALKGQEVEGRRNTGGGLTDKIQGGKCPDDNASSVKSLRRALNWAELSQGGLPIDLISELNPKPYAFITMQNKKKCSMQEKKNVKGHRSVRDSSMHMGLYMI